jgi:hypothetical protein
MAVAFYARPPRIDGASSHAPTAGAYAGAVPTVQDHERRLSRAAAKLGVGASAFAVFTCGWLAMRSTTWPKMLLFSALALVAAMVASAFSRMAR